MTTKTLDRSIRAFDNTIKRLSISLRRISLRKWSEFSETRDRRGIDGRRKGEVFTRCSLPLPLLHLVGREEKLYALDSQVSGLSRRVIQTGVTAARFIVFVNLGRVTSRRGSGYHPPRRRTRHDVYAPPSPPPPIHHRPRRLIRRPSFVFRFIPIGIYAAERTIKTVTNHRNAPIDSPPPRTPTILETDVFNLFLSISLEIFSKLSDRLTMDRRSI